MRVSVNIKQELPGRVENISCRGSVSKNPSKIPKF
jgi:hypothetical protein